jgi:hypothetical protein
MDSARSALLRAIEADLPGVRDMLATRPQDTPYLGMNAHLGRNLTARRAALRRAAS